MDKFAAEFLAREHLESTRRYFLQFAVAGFTSLPWWADAADENQLLQAIEKLGNYLTPSEKFRNVERHKPLPYKRPLEERLELGLDRKTWELDVIADPESNSVIGNPMSKELGNALDFKTLMAMAETKAVRYLKIMTCNNLDDPLGMGLWEGVPLRDVIWLTKPEKNIRRLFYRGYHNENPKQIFQSSLSIGRVLEDPPSHPPVILCTKMNGEWLSGERGGPVRMIVPESYGYKSVKWIEKIYLTNNHQANDTYAKANNDIDSHMKSYARILKWPKEKSVKAGESFPLTGVAQSGMSGLKKVQYWISSKAEELPEDDHYFTQGNWKDAQILPPPDHWGNSLRDGKLPEIPLQFDEDGTPLVWPPVYTIAHWAVLIPGIEKAGEYEVFVRTIDRNDVAQPMPRPFDKSGGNQIQWVPLNVTSA